MNRQDSTTRFPKIAGATRFTDKAGVAAGIYIHIPFCLKKCPYCNFYSTTGLSLKDEFIKALFKEIASHPRHSLSCDTIYFGGGTPSLLSPGEIFSVLDKLFQYFNIRQDAEITLEVNPGTIHYKNFRGYIDAGINRLNIGVQSFQDNHLKFLGRIHTARDASEALKASGNAGFSNIGIDLIYGLSDQSIQDWKKDLETALSFHPEHLSCYMLAYERKTPFYKALKNGLLHPADEKLEGDFFSFTWEFLPENGYIPYEISNFSRNDRTTERCYRSRHNQKYWHFAPYIGLGPSAHSYMDPIRYWNVESVDEYIRKIQATNCPVTAEETLTMEQQMIESIFLGFRTTDGIDLKRFEKKFGLTFYSLVLKPLQNLTQEGYLILSDTFCRLTPSGMRFHDSICDLLIGAMP